MTAAAAPALSGLLALWYAIEHPPAADLAAQTARAQLWERVGPSLWWTRWYGGIELPGYGLVSPPLMATVGVTAVGVLSLLLVGVLSRPLLAGARRPTAGALALVAAQAANVWSGRTTFALGAAVGVGALLLVERGRLVSAGAAAVLTSLTSPVAGLVLGVPLLALLAAGPGPSRRRSALLAGAAALAGILLLSLPFPAGGSGPQPFAGWLLRDCLLVTLPLLVLPVGRRVRVGAAVAAVLLLAAYAIDSPVGSNASRVPLLLAVPAVVANLRLPRPVVALAAALLAIFPVDQLRDDLGALEPARTTAAYYAPLLAALAAEPGLQSGRVEVVEPRDHWHAVHVAARFSLARGWLRQADTERTHALYDPAPLRPAPLTAASYRRFLDDFAVAVVVLPDAPIDFASRQEADLVRRGLPYLQDAGRRGAFTVYRVRDPAPMASGPGRVTAVRDDLVEVTATEAGTIRLRVWWSRWLRVSGPAGGAVRRDGDWVAVDVQRAGSYRIAASLL